MPTPIRVLVVDDEPLIRWSLSEALAGCGFDVAVAEDGHSAVDALSGGVTLPDVVLLDYRLPDSDGLSVFEKVRELLPGGQVILMTAFGTPDVTTRAIDLGAYRVVTKPFEVSEMATVIRQAHRTVAGEAGNSADVAIRGVHH